MAIYGRMSKHLDWVVLEMLELWSEAKAVASALGAGLTHKWFIHSWPSHSVDLKRTTTSSAAAIASLHQQYCLVTATRDRQLHPAPPPPGPTKTLNSMIAFAQIAVSYPGHPMPLPSQTSRIVAGKPAHKGGLSSLAEQAAIDRLRWRR